MLYSHLFKKTQYADFQIGSNKKHIVYNLVNTYILIKFDPKQNAQTFNFFL